MADFDERDTPADLDASEEWEDEGGSTEEPRAAAAEADGAVASAAREEANERGRRWEDANAEHWHGRADPEATGQRPDER